MPKIITSPAERVQKTVAQAYKTSTGQEVQQSQEILYTGKHNEQRQRTKTNLYNNLLGLSGSFRGVMKEFQQVLEAEQSKPENSNLGELELQDKVCELFLQGKLESGNPYTISKERMQLLLKGFDQLDYQSEVKMIAMRHGHRDGNDLTELGIQEAQQAGSEYNFGSQDMIVGTHQTVIESVLISLVGGSQGLSPQDAWRALHPAWKKPYKTAQVTEFVFSKNTDGEKTLTVTTNNHTEVFTEKDCNHAYTHLLNSSFIQ